jgi:hypothetical protein
MPEREPSKPARHPRPSSTPEDYPSSSSGYSSGGDLSYVELVSDIQNRLGRLSEAVETLKEISKEHGTELKGMGKDLHAIKIVGGLLALTASGLGWIIHEVVQYMSTHAK